MDVRRTAGLVTAFVALVAAPAFAQTAPASPQPLPPLGTPTPAPERFSFHAQSTDTQQYHGTFPAAYSGPLSMANTPDTQKTIDVTLYLGARLWDGGAIYIDPELDQGFGLGNDIGGPPYTGTVGVAGYVSGEAYKVGRDSSYGRIQRFFVRQTIDLGGDEQTVDPDVNQLGASERVEHITLTAGKFAVTDVFDDNVYAHDPKNDFLNWSIIDMGAFDYAADAWGYTYGTSAELAGAESTLRAGLFQLSAEPNGIAIEHTPFRQYSGILEFERRTSLFGGHPGAIKALVYGDDAYLGSYADALALAAATGALPNTADVRTGRHWKLGAGLNVAQEIASHVGVFARLSAMNGTYEAEEFTDIDRAVSLGTSIDGGWYHRPNDTFGLAGSFNGISSVAQQYFAAGGTGVLVGDGALTYGGERILETYYKLGITKFGAITADYQRVADPAYNIERGPISVFGLRYHVNI
jgi:high affinity Mn2+ porin